MPDYLGADQRKTKEEEKEDKPIRGERRAGGRAGAAPPGPASRYHGLPLRSSSLPAFTAGKLPEHRLGRARRTEAAAALPAAISATGAAGGAEGSSLEKKKKTEKIPVMLFLRPSPVP